MFAPVQSSSSEIYCIDWNFFGRDEYPARSSTEAISFETSPTSLARMGPETEVVPFLGGKHSPQVRQVVSACFT